MNGPSHPSGKQIETAAEINGDASSLFDPTAIDFCPDARPYQTKASPQILG